MELEFLFARLLPLLDHVHLPLTERAIFVHQYLDGLWLFRAVGKQAEIVPISKQGLSFNYSLELHLINYSGRNFY